MPTNARDQGAQRAGCRASNQMTSPSVFCLVVGQGEAVKLPPSHQSQAPCCVGQPEVSLGLDSLTPPCFEKSLAFLSEAVLVARLALRCSRQILNTEYPVAADAVLVAHAVSPHPNLILISISAHIPAPSSTLLCAVGRHCIFSSCRRPPQLRHQSILTARPIPSKMKTRRPTPAGTPPLVPLILLTWASAVCANLQPFLPVETATPLAKRQTSCLADFFSCADQGAVFNGVCCQTGQRCAIDANNQPACCPAG